MVEEKIFVFDDGGKIFVFDDGGKIFLFDDGRKIFVFDGGGTISVWRKKCVFGRTCAMEEKSLSFIRAYTIKKR